MDDTSGTGREREAAIDSRFGWLLVALGFLLLAVLWGAVFTYTVYADALASAFDLTGLQTSAVFSVATAAFFVVGGTVGILVARTPLRPVLAAAGVATAASVVALQVADSFLGLAAAFATFGIAGGTTFVLTISLVPQWFERYRGTATGVTIAGNGLGVQVFPFVWLWLMDRTSIRQSFLVVGGVAVVLLFAATLAYRRPPGIQAEDGGSVDRAWLRALALDRRFLAAWVGLVIAWSWYFVLSASMIGILTEAGIARSVAATAFGLVGGVSVASRVGSGGVADWIGARGTFAGGVVLSAIGLLVLAFAASTAAMYVSLISFGTGLGAVAALYAPIVIRAFGSGNATAVMGVFTYCSAAAGFLAPLVVDALAGAVGSYTPPLVSLGGLTVVGAGLFYWGTDPTVR